MSSLYKDFYDACYEGHYDIVKILIKYVEDVNVPIDNRPPIFLSADYRVIKLLIENGADIKSNPEFTGELLNHLIEDHHHESAKYLINLGASLEYKRSGVGTSRQFSAIEMAACENNYECFSYILDTGNVFSRKTIFEIVRKYYKDDDDT